MKPSIIEFYEGKNVLITGGTGFIGKPLIEKLLRSCPGIGTIYVLLRAKKGVTEEERLKTICGTPIFDYLREKQPDVFKKLKVVSGDILVNNLGLSKDDRQELQRNCNIIFHSAACVRFDQKLKDAVDLNMTGTLRVLRLAETMENLKAFVHLSTAYCRCDLEVLEEKIYPAVHDPEKIMDLVEWLDDKTLDHLEPKLISPEPNTYAYTKAITEHLVGKFSSKFPIAIGRPSIITASWKEPMPGWIDNLNGPTGLIVTNGKGVLQSMICEGSYYLDCVPVDVIVNGCVLIAYTTALNKSKDVCVYNMTLSDALKITWREIVDKVIYWQEEYPYLMALWYHTGDMRTNRLVHYFYIIMFQYLPAYFIDMLLFLCGQKTFMVKVQNRVIHGIQILKYYTLKEWHFRNTNFLSLRKNITESENEIFFTDLSILNTSEYIRDYVAGTRHYLLKEDPATLPKARKLHRIRYWIYIISKILLFSLILWFLFVKCDILNVIISIHSNVSGFLNSGHADVEIREIE